MTTPIYKRLKNGTTLYVLPGAGEDFSATQQNTNVQMTFSKFVLVKLPARNFVTNDPNVRPVFDINANNLEFFMDTNKLPAPTWGEAVVESLRNYVANQESTMRATRVGKTEYYYNPAELRTVSERVFWKWLRKNGALSLEPALPNEEWDPEQAKFLPAGATPDFLHRYMWRERMVEPYELFDRSTVIDAVGLGRYKLRLQRTSNFKPGDYVRLVGFTTQSYGVTVADGPTVKLVGVTSFDADKSINDQIIFEWNTTREPLPQVTAGSYVQLDYEPVVKYIGEISGTNNVQGAQSAYTEVYAHMPMQSGKTPSIMFETITDGNYRPGMEFPVLPDQVQSQIRGAENDLSPITVNPENFPGDRYGQFDTDEFKYTTATGDVIRRAGEFYGIGNRADNGTPVIETSDIPYNANPRAPMTWPEFDAKNIDGISLDFNLKDYMLARAVEANSFGEFSASAVNDQAPADFEFNAILWFYDLQDVSGKTDGAVTNLYGIEFLDNPDRDEVDAAFANTIPVTKKRVANGQQDGTAFMYSLDLTMQIESEDSPMAFDPDRVYSLFGFELYNEAMGRLAVLTDAFFKTLGQVSSYRAELEALRGMVYTQQSLDSIRARMDSLDSLLKLYSTLQIGSSDSVVPFLDTSSNPPQVRLRSVDKRYSQVINVNADTLYKTITLTGQSSNNKAYATESRNITFADGKDFLVLVNNNDNDGNVYGNNDATLQIVLDKDLAYKQTAEFLITATPDARCNKGLEIYVNYNDSTAVEAKRLHEAPLDLPVTKTQAGAIEPATLLQDNGALRPVPKYVPYMLHMYKDGPGSTYLALDFDGDLTNLVQGSHVYLNNFTVKLQSQNTPLYFNGQFEVAKSEYMPSPLQSIKLLNTGQLTLATGQSAGPTGVQSQLFESPTYSQFSDARAQLQWLLNGQNNVSVEAANLFMAKAGDGYLPKATTLDVGLAPPSGFVWSGNIPPQVRLVPLIRTRVIVKIPRDNRMEKLNAELLATTPDNSLLPLAKYMNTTPYIDFNRGYSVKVTRINEAPDMPVSRMFERYNVEITRL